MTLDNYIHSSRLIPKVIKIDVEGSEFHILKGAYKTIQNHRPVLIMEFNPMAARSASTTIQKYVDFLKKNSYSLVVLKRGLLGYYRLSDFEQFNEKLHCKDDNRLNVICLPKDQYFYD